MPLTASRSSRENRSGSANKSFQFDQPVEMSLPKRKPAWKRFLIKRVYPTKAWQLFEKEVSSLKKQHLLPRKMSTASIAGVLGVLVLGVGLISAIGLVQVDQDIRQQALIEGDPGGGGPSCTSLGGTCKGSCSGSEIQTNGSCIPASNVCCKNDQNVACPSGSACNVGASSCGANYTQTGTCRQGGANGVCCFANPGQPTPPPDDGPKMVECFRTDQDCVRTIVPEADCPNNNGRYWNREGCLNAQGPVSIGWNQTCQADPGRKCTCPNGQEVDRAQKCPDDPNSLECSGGYEKIDNDQSTRNGWERANCNPDTQKLSTKPINDDFVCATCVAKPSINCYDYLFGCGVKTLHQQDWWATENIKTCDDLRENLNGAYYNTRSECEAAQETEGDLICWKYSYSANTCISISSATFLYSEERQDEAIQAGEIDDSQKVVNPTSCRQITFNPGPVYYDTAGECLANIDQDFDEEEAGKILCYHEEQSCARKVFEKTEYSDCGNVTGQINGTYYETKERCEDARVSSFDCFNAFNNCSIESFSESDFRNCAEIGDGSGTQPLQQNTYYSNLAECKQNQPSFKIGPGTTCPSVNGCVCSTGPEKDQQKSKGQTCASFKSDGDTCDISAECRSGFCLQDSPENDRTVCKKPSTIGGSCNNQFDCLTGFCDSGVCVDEEPEPEDVEEEEEGITSCSQLGTVSVEIRKQSGSSQGDGFLQGDVLDIRCTTSEGSPERLGLGSEILVTGSGFAAASGSQLTGFEVPRSGEYEVSCNITSFAKCGAQTTITADLPSFSCRLWIGGGSVMPGTLDCRPSPSTGEYLWQKCAPPHSASGDIQDGQAVGLWSPCAVHNTGLPSAESLLAAVGLGSGQACPPVAACGGPQDLRDSAALIDPGLSQDELDAALAATASAATPDIALPSLRDLLEADGDDKDDEPIINCDEITSFNACLAAGPCEFLGDGCTFAEITPGKPHLAGCTDVCDEEGGCTCRNICEQGNQEIDQGQTCGGYDEDWILPPEQISTLSSCSQGCARDQGCGCPEECRLTTVDKGLTCNGDVIPIEEIIDAYDEETGTQELETCTEECPAGAECRCQLFCKYNRADAGETCGGVDPYLGGPVCASISTQSVCLSDDYPYCAWIDDKCILGEREPVEIDPGILDTITDAIDAITDAVGGIFSGGSDREYQLCAGNEISENSIRGRDIERCQIPGDVTVYYMCPDSRPILAQRRGWFGGTYRECITSEKICPGEGFFNPSQFSGSTSCLYYDSSGDYYSRGYKCPNNEPIVFEGTNPTCQGPQPEAQTIGQYEACPEDFREEYNTGKYILTNCYCFGGPNYDVLDVCTPACQSSRTFDGQTTHPSVRRCLDGNILANECVLSYHTELEVDGVLQCRSLDSIPDVNCDEARTISLNDATTEGTECINGQGQVRRQCEEGTVYNQSVGCETAERAQCDPARLIPERVESANVFIPAGSGSFVECTNNQTERVQCPEGLLFGTGSYYDEDTTIAHCAQACANTSQTMSYEGFSSGYHPPSNNTCVLNGFLYHFCNEGLRMSFNASTNSHECVAP